MWNMKDRILLLTQCSLDIISAMEETCNIYGSENLGMHAPSIAGTHSVAMLLLQHDCFYRECNHDEHIKTFSG